AARQRQKPARSWRTDLLTDVPAADNRPPAGRNPSILHAPEGNCTTTPSRTAGAGRLPGEEPMGQQLRYNRVVALAAAVVVEQLEGRRLLSAGTGDGTGEHT